MELRAKRRKRRRRRFPRKTILNMQIMMKNRKDSNSLRCKNKQDSKKKERDNCKRNRRSWNNNRDS
jgi:hypothetical protein